MGRLTNQHLVPCGARCENAAYGAFVFAGLLLLSALTALANATPRSQRARVAAVRIQATQNEKDARKLELGKPMERALPGGHTDSYEIELISGQYLQVIVDQRGIDVVLLLFAPDGKSLVELDSPNESQGPERLLWLADEAGNYRLEVRSLDAEAASGMYEVRIEELRPAEPQDKTLISAQKAFAEGIQLDRQGGAESLQRAVGKYEEALTLSRAAVDRLREVFTLTNLGAAYEELGNNQKALDSYFEALPLWSAAGQPSGEGNTLHSIGFVYNSLGEKQKALEYFNRALPMARAAGDRKGVAVTLTNIGRVYADLDEQQKALEYYNQALPLRQSIGDRKGEALALYSIGEVYDSSDQKQKAFDYYDRALTLWRKVHDRRSEGLALHSIGMVYSSLGEKHKALDYYYQALKIRQIDGSRGEQAITLNNIAVVSNSLGERQKALDNHNQALGLWRAIGNRRGEAQTLSNIGSVYYSMGQKQKALEYYNQALPLRRAAMDRRGEASTLHSIGGVYLSLGEKEKALDFYTQALPLRRAVGDLRGEANTLYGIARAHRDRGYLAEARAQIEAALPKIESIRASVLREELRSSYLESVLSFYEFYITLLMDLHKQHPSEGHDAAALEASERARARSLLDLLTEARADIREGVDPRLVDHQRLLEQLLNAKGERLMRLLSGKHTEAQTTATKNEIEQISTEFQEVQAKIRATSPRYSALTQPLTLGLKEIQKLLDPETLLLEYALGDEHSYLWAVTQSSIASFELPRRTEVEAAARRVYGLLTARNRRGEAETIQQRRALRAQADAQFLQAAVALSQMVLSPVASLLKTKRLLIVSEGALQYIPFASLPTPLVGHQSSAVSERMSGDSQTGQPTTVYMPLMVDHEIVSLPSASTLAVLRRETAGRRSAAKAVAVLADPVFDKDDDRLRRGARGRRATTARAAIVNASQEVPDIERAVKDVGLAGEGNLARLPFSRREAEAILAVVPRGEGTIALDFKASRATATSTELGHYRIVHFATHGLLDSEHPVLSGVVFSLVDEHGTLQDGFLRLHDIYNLNLPSELVVLSACQTALGKDIRGEGLVGLTRGFMYAGAARVVASLWQVDDAATAELMRHFYRGMMGRGLRPAAALQAAQLEMWKQGRWKSPYYWAAFVLQGEWK